MSRVSESTVTSDVSMADSSGMKSMLRRWKTTTNKQTNTRDADADATRQVNSKPPRQRMSNAPALAFLLLQLQGDAADLVAAFDAAHQVRHEAGDLVAHALGRQHGDFINHTLVEVKVQSELHEHNGGWK